MNKKLAEWAGLKVWVIPQTEDEVICVHPDDPDSCLTVNFTASLDDCFRWLMPKIYAYVLQSFSKGHHLHHASVALPYTNIQDIQTFEANVERNKNPALALCRAIEQIIDKEKAN